MVRTELADAVIGCAIEVHGELGPGLLESACERCLVRELDLSGLKFEFQAPFPLLYKGVHIDCGYRLDIVVEGQLLLELESVERLLPVHDAQVMTYLKLTSLQQALLMNFNMPRLKEGFKSFLNPKSGILQSSSSPR